MKQLCVLALFALAACGPTTPPTRQEEVAALTGAATSGKTVFDTNCASCHGADGKGTASSSNKDVTATVKTQKAADFIATILNGVMNTSMAGYPQLSNQQLADVYAYIKTL